MPPARAGRSTGDQARRGGCGWRGETRRAPRVSPRGDRLPEATATTRCRCSPRRRPPAGPDFTSAGGAARPLGRPRPESDTVIVAEPAEFGNHELLAWRSHPATQWLGVVIPGCFLSGLVRVFRPTWRIRPVCPTRPVSLDGRRPERRADCRRRPGRGAPRPARRGHEAAKFSLISLVTCSALLEVLALSYEGSSRTPPNTTTSAGLAAVA